MTVRPTRDSPSPRGPGLHPRAIARAAAIPPAAIPRRRRCRSAPPAAEKTPLRRRPQAFRRRRPAIRRSAKALGNSLGAPPPVRAGIQTPWMSDGVRRQRCQTPTRLGFLTVSDANKTRILVMRHAPASPRRNPWRLRPVAAKPWAVPQAAVGCAASGPEPQSGTSPRIGHGPQAPEAAGAEPPGVRHSRTSGRAARAPPEPRPCGAIGRVSSLLGRGRGAFSEAHGRTVPY